MKAQAFHAPAPPAYSESNSSPGLTSPKQLYAVAKQTRDLLEKLDRLQQLADRYPHSPESLKALDDLWKLKRLIRAPDSVRAYQRLLDARGIKESKLEAKEIETFNMLYIVTGHPEEAVKFNKHLLDLNQLSGLARAVTRYHLRNAYLEVGDYAAYLSDPYPNTSPMNRFLKKFLAVQATRGIPSIPHREGLSGDLHHLAQTKNVPLRIYVKSDLASKLRKIPGMDLNNPLLHAIETADKGYFAQVVHDINILLDDRSGGTSSVQLDDVKFEYPQPLFDQSDFEFALGRKFAFRDALEDGIVLMLEATPGELLGGINLGNGLVHIDFGNLTQMPAFIDQIKLSEVGAHEIMHSFGEDDLTESTLEFFNELRSEGHLFSYEAIPSVLSLDAPFLRRPGELYSTLSEFNRLAIGWPLVQHPLTTVSDLLYPSGQPSVRVLPIHSPPAALGDGWNRPIQKRGGFLFPFPWLMAGLQWARRWASSQRRRRLSHVRRSFSPRPSWRQTLAALFLTVFLTVHAASAQQTITINHQVPPPAVMKVAPDSPETKEWEDFFASPILDQLPLAIMQKHMGTGGSSLSILETLRSNARGLSPELDRLLGSLIDLNPSINATTERGLIIAGWANFNRSELLPRGFYVPMAFTSLGDSIYPYFTAFQVDHITPAHLTSGTQSIAWPILDVHRISTHLRNSFKGLTPDETPAMLKDTAGEQSMKEDLAATAVNPQHPFVLESGDTPSPVVDDQIRSTYNKNGSVDSTAISRDVDRWTESHEIAHGALDLMPPFPVALDYFGVPSSVLAQWDARTQVDLIHETAAYLRMLKEGPLTPVTVLRLKEALIHPATQPLYYYAAAILNHLDGNSDINSWVNGRDKNQAEALVERLVRDPQLPEKAGRELDRIFPGLSKIHLTRDRNYVWLLPSVLGTSVIVLALTGIGLRRRYRRQTAPAKSGPADTPQSIIMIEPGHDVYEGLRALALHDPGALQRLLKGVYEEPKPGERIMFRFTAESPAQEEALTRLGLVASESRQEAIDQGNREIRKRLEGLHPSGVAAVRLKAGRLTLTLARAIVWRGKSYKTIDILLQKELHKFNPAFQTFKNYAAANPRSRSDALKAFRKYIHDPEMLRVQPDHATPVYYVLANDEARAHMLEALQIEQAGKSWFMTDEEYAHIKEQILSLRHKSVIPDPKSIKADRPMPAPPALSQTQLSHTVQVQFDLAIGRRDFSPSTLLQQIDLNGFVEYEVDNNGLWSGAAGQPHLALQDIRCIGRTWRGNYLMSGLFDVPENAHHIEYRMHLKINGHETVVHNYHTYGHGNPAVDIVPESFLLARVPDSDYSKENLAIGWTGDVVFDPTLVEVHGISYRRIRLSVHLGRDNFVLEEITDPKRVGLTVAAQDASGAMHPVQSLEVVAQDEPRNYILTGLISVADGDGVPFQKLMVRNRHSIKEVKLTPIQQAELRSIVAPPDPADTQIVNFESMFLALFFLGMHGMGAGVIRWPQTVEMLALGAVYQWIQQPTSHSARLHPLRYAA